MGIIVRWRRFFGTYYQLAVTCQNKPSLIKADISLKHATSDTVDEADANMVDEDEGSDDDELVHVATTPSTQPGAAKRAFGAAFGSPSLSSTATSQTTSSASRTARAAIAALLRTAEDVEERLRRDGALAPQTASSSGSARHGTSNRASGDVALSRFCDAMLMASHEDVEDGRADAQCEVLATTLHQAKGLEWDRVFIPRMTEGSLPLLPRYMLANSLELCEHLEEERRLCYVGFTRARCCLTLSWASEPSGPSSNDTAVGVARSAPHAMSSKPSRFLPSPM